MKFFFNFVKSKQKQDFLHKLKVTFTKVMIFYFFGKIYMIKNLY